jgi:hypothetical protein
MTKRPDKFVLSPEQLTEVERRLRDDEVASDEEVREMFARLGKGSRALKPARQ